jgi:hypothetical protein
LHRAMERAEKEGVLVVSPSLGLSHGIDLFSLDRDPLSDPDDFWSYKHTWINELRRRNLGKWPTGLLVPVSSKCFAGPSASNHYIFGRYGGISWSAPYLAGLYALACQVNPAITPKLFLEKALETGKVVETEVDGEKQRIDRIVNPVKLIESF